MPWSKSAVFFSTFSFTPKFSNSTEKIETPLNLKLLKSDKTFSRSKSIPTRSSVSAPIFFSSSHLDRQLFLRRNWRKEILATSASIRTTSSCITTAWSRPDSLASSSSARCTKEIGRWQNPFGTKWKTNGKTSLSNFVFNNNSAPTCYCETNRLRLNQRNYSFKYV